jgi:hypothetical protein
MSIKALFLQSIYRPKNSLNLDVILVGNTFSRVSVPINLIVKQSLRSFAVRTICSFLVKVGWENHAVPRKPTSGFKSPMRKRSN